MCSHLGFSANNLGASPAKCNQSQKVLGKCSKLNYADHSDLHANFLSERCLSTNTLIRPAMTQGASLTLGLTISRSPKENRWSSGPHCLHSSRKIEIIVSNVSAL